MGPMKTPMKNMTFFTSHAVSKQASVIHSSCYKLSQSMLRRSETEPAVIPIDNMGYLAAINENTLTFIDRSKTVSINEKQGFPVKIVWKLHLAEGRDSDDQHIPMDISFFDENLNETQQQLTGEFYKALMLMDESYRDNLIPSVKTEYVPLRETV